MNNKNADNKLNLFNIQKENSIDNFTNPFSIAEGNNFNNPFSIDSRTNNPFAKQPIQEQNSTTNPIKRINDYDSIILNKVNSDPQEGIDYRVQEKESLLRDLDAKIEIADSYGTQNEGLSLRAKKRRLLQDIEALKRQKSYGLKIPKQNALKEKVPVLYDIMQFVSKNILAKVSSNVGSVVALKESLESLSQINNSIDELLDMKVPYGEKSQNYEVLTKYLNEANVIHSKITKSLKK